MSGPDRPNILFIVADEWRGDSLGSLGAPGLATPHLDRLATRGVQFRRHFANASPCGPARASLLTGLQMHRHGQIGNGTPLDPDLPTFASEYCAAGYRVGLVGYTDTPQRPGGDDAASQWLAPGFEPVAPFLYADGFRCWRERLAAAGVPLPEATLDLFAAAESERPFDATAPWPPARYPAELSDSALMSEAAIGFIAAARGPWLLHVNFWRPHPPMFAPAPYHAAVDPADMAPPVRPEAPETIAAMHPFLAWTMARQYLPEYLHADWPLGQAPAIVERRMRATYAGNCQEVDAQVGRLLAAADPETIVIFMSDHGDQFGDNWIYGRRGCFDGHFHVPLIIADPGRPAGHGSRIDRLSSHVDLFPTLCDLAGLPTPAGLDGSSLRPFLDGAAPAERPDEAIVAMDFRDPLRRRAQSHFGLGDDACRFVALIDDSYKLVRFDGLPPLLFDRRADPRETRDLAGDPVHGAVLADLGARLALCCPTDWRSPAAAWHRPYDGPLRRLAAD